MFHDIHHGAESKLERQHIAGTDCDQVVHADNTICIGLSTAGLNRLLAAIEVEGCKYGMKLNKRKCEFIGIGNTGSVKIADGQPVKAVEEAKYLGCMLNRKDDAETDVRKRILDCTITIKRLHIFFCWTDCSTRRT